MTWVLRTEPRPKHTCLVPMAVKDLSVPQADGEHGDMWRCDECHRLWVLFVNEWEPAAWWQRARHRRAGYPPKPPYDVHNADGSTTHHSSQTERNAGMAAVYTIPAPRNAPPPLPIGDTQ